jgi:beta-mannosidase
MLITLLPGETRSCLVSTANEVDPAAFADPLVLRSANALGSPVMRS